MITSELVTNAMVHAGTASFGLEVVQLTEVGGVAVIVIDSSLPQSGKTLPLAASTAAG